MAVHWLVQKVRHGSHGRRLQAGPLGRIVGRTFYAGGLGPAEGSDMLQAPDGLGWAGRTSDDNCSAVTTVVF